LVDGRHAIVAHRRGHVGEVRQCQTLTYTTLQG
jgi:hypothetical protein